MALLTLQTPAETGTTLTYASCTGGGDTFANNGKVYLHIKNASGGSITVTIAKTSSATVNDPVLGILTKADVAVAIGAGAEKMIGPFKPDAFNATAGTGLVSITYSGVTSLTIAAIQV